MTVVTIHKLDGDFNEQWFFSTNHCQPDLDENWVPITHYNTTPEIVRRRNNTSCIENAKVEEIENPNPFYRPIFHTQTVLSVAIEAIRQINNIGK